MSMRAALIDVGRVISAMKVDEKRANDFGIITQKFLEPVKKKYMNILQSMVFRKVNPQVNIHWVKAFIILRKKANGVLFLEKEDISTMKKR